MKFLLLIIVFIPFSVVTYSQKKEQPHYFGLSGGYSFNGSGDIHGVAFTTEFSKNFKKRLSWNIGLTGTIHDGDYPEFFVVNGREIDGSVRFTVAGVQLSGHIGYSLLKTYENEFQIRGGGLLRYQSSSLPDDVTTLYPAATGLDFPVIVFNNQTPQRTVTIGASLQAHYSYTFNNKWVIGALGGFQFDSEGDNISQLSLTAGFRF